MKQARIDFEDLSWEEPVAGMRFRGVRRQGRRLRLVEITGEFEEPEGCAGSHIGCVLEGEMEIDFPDRTEKFSPGNGIFILGGTEEKHRVRVIGERVMLLLVDEVVE